MKALQIFLVTFMSVSCSILGINSEEGPKYNIISQDGEFEIRQYSSYLVAQTTVKGDIEESTSKAFRILAGYIFGKNESKTKISMTSPVTQKKSQNIKMTTPVMQSKSQDGYTMSFMMPSKYELKDLPIPLDKRISLKKEPSKLVALIKYSWWSSKEKTDRKIKELLFWLKENQEYEVIASPYYAGYNPPWTIPFFRRNEVLVEIKNIQEQAQ